ncbi:transcriptional regulator, XRE family [Ammonifex degensii KC4]|uniref:Transcriptional regulator, XRE family n=1 Tax=Ammonifex degensii (strain DSM 10501 / KC4) TaxID=429009 RepID=C9RA87_AMMDK|nr:helix-turn-helix transcriptional regulator [Ammonifex degensii]ACX51196.1 transcriptional regulator, XRE family [Ammonifex degensii KC4]
MPGQSETRHVARRIIEQAVLDALKGDQGALLFLARACDQDGYERYVFEVAGIDPQKVWDWVVKKLSTTPKERPETKLQALRRSYGLTLKELSRRVGISATFLGLLERGEKRASPATRELLAQHFNVPEHELFDPEGYARKGGNE